ncbi:hypothetical protein [uncultured Cardiobacterium sp.]|uniref:hypothetical protein n=1 Tax=uncultured Cardiobacterium sp. TaxID=417619 RepID=UPI00262056D4|nr:hypothetical protein [uncultured Cardiobacterium sp.]
MPDRPALYWYKHPRLIQHANRRCFWLLVPATLCAIILVRGTPLTLALPAAVFLPVLVALAGREIGNAFIGAKAPVARIDHDGLALARARPAGHLGGGRLNWQRYWPELQDVDFRYNPQQLVLKYRDGNSEYGDTPKASDKARRRRKYEALGGWLYIHTAPVLDEEDNHDLYLALSRLHGHTEPLPAHIAADRTIAAELEEMHREAFAADLAELAASSTQAPPHIRPFGWLLLALNLATALALPLLALLSNAAMTLFTGICAALILYGLHHGLHSFADYRRQAYRGELPAPPAPPPEVENARYWYKHPRVVRSCNIRLYFWLLLALFLLTGTTATAPRWYLAHPGWALFDLILIALVLRVLWRNFRHGFLAPAEPFASADRHGLRFALASPRQCSLTDLPVNHPTYKRFGAERITGGKLYSGARNCHIAWQELLDVHAVAEYGVFPEQLQFHIRDFTLAHSHRSINTKRLCDYAAICDIAATANAACDGTPPTPGAWQPPLRVRPFGWLLLALNLACFTGWLTGLIPLKITAYDGLHGHPYGIFLYPNPFSIGLLNLIALALPWRWQADFRP